jgi:hypothetical protein
MYKVMLLGDSIFDNDIYVPGEPAVVEQLNQRLEGCGRAELLAVDGHVTHHMLLNHDFSRAGARVYGKISD